MRVGEDPVVVEGERTVRARPVRQPVRAGGVTAPAHLGRVGHEGRERDGDDPHPGVAVRVAVGAQLFQVQPGDVGQAGLLGQFARRRRLRGLVGQDETAGQCQAARVRVLPPLDEQHPQRAVPDREDGQIDGDGEGLEAVLVIALHAHHPLSL